MNENFTYLVKEYGPLSNTAPFTTAQAEHLYGKLPNGLLEFWLECGIGMWASGKFQFCCPDLMQGVVKMLLEGDPEFDHEKTHVFAFGAFGELVVWNEERQKISIDLPYLEATADSTRDGWKPFKADDAIMSSMLRISESTSFTLFESAGDGAPLFNRCLARLGHLALGECYGMFPPLALGGTKDLGSVRRVRALEHFAILAQLGPIRLVDYSDGQERFVRHLGTQG